MKGIEGVSLTIDFVPPQLAIQAPTSSIAIQFLDLINCNFFYAFSVNLTKIVIKHTKPSCNRLKIESYERFRFESKNKEINCYRFQHARF